MRYRNIKYWSITIIFLLLAISARTTQAQSDPQPATPPDLRFTRLSAADGLAHNGVTAVIQDGTGFMWFGTEDGLSRYDGYRFTTFRHEPGNPQSLSSNSINDLLLDDKGRLWIATATGGVSIFDPLTESFSQFQPTEQTRLDRTNVTSLFKDEAGSIWLGMANGQVRQFVPTTGLFREYQLSTESDPRFVWGIERDTEGMVWLAASTLFGLDPETAVVAPYQQTAGQANNAPPPPPPPDTPGGQPGPPPGGRPPGGPTETLFEDSRGTLWVALAGNLHKFDRQRGEFSRFMPDNPPDPVLRVVSLHEDDEGILWVGSQTGLYLFDLDREQFISRYAPDSLQPDSLSGEIVRDIYEDNGGIIWLATDNGLSMVNRQQAQFSRYQHHPLDTNSLAAPAAGISYVDSDGIVWVDSALYLNAINRVTGEVARYTDAAEGRSPFARGAPPYLQYWLGIHDDGQGSLWLGRWEGLFRFDKAAGDFAVLAPAEHLAEGQTRGGYRAMAADGQTVWLATDDKLYRFDIPTEQFTLAWQNPEQQGISPIFALHVAADGMVWFDLRGGIGRYNPSTDQFQPFVLADGDSSQRINDIYEDSQGIIWFGSSGGLHRLDPQSGEFRLYREKDGLPDNNVQAILADDEGQLWLSTFRGIARFDPQADTFRAYGLRDGLPGSEFKPGAAFKTAGGELFFGSTGGLVSFFPADIIDNTFQPPVVLTELRVLNEPVPLGQDSLLQWPIYATDSVTFGPEDEVVSFEFAALSYAAPQNNHYRYWLEGFDKEWNQVDDGRRFANYTNLPAGDYVFHVQGSNSDGLWSDQEVRLNITVLPHWFASRWAIAFYIIGTVAGVVGFYSWRTSSIRRQNQLLERQVAQRTQALSDQAEQLAIAKDRAEAANRTKSAFLSNMSHELRSPLNAILGFAQVMTRSTNLSAENRESLEIISRSGEHLLTLINQVLDLSKIEAGQATLNESDFDLYRLLADVESMFRLQAREQNLQLLLEWDDNVPQFIRADEVKLRQVLINLLNNALKFTAEGGVSVRVASSGGLAAAEGRQPVPCHLLFQVEDTGPGIVDAEMEHLFEAFAQTETGRRSQEGTGLGLPISRHFVQLMGGNMSVSSQVGMGSIFHFDIKAQVATTADHPPIAAARRVIALEPGQPHYRILIVDDLPTNRQLLVHLLKPLGFELYEAADGREAIELWQKVEPQLIWMDMRMPVLNGYEATQQIKATTQGQATAVIALTASSLEGERHLILSAGCDDYLRKPFRESEIFDMMSKHLGVRYLYEETMGQVNGRSSEAVLTTADLRPISPVLLNKLAEAIESINLAQIDEAIAEIQQELPETAAKLQQLITHFEYDSILKMVEEARG